jgi:hypothetical protein
VVQVDQQQHERRAQLAEVDLAQQAVEAPAVAEAGQGVAEDLLLGAGPGGLHLFALAGLAQHAESLQAQPPQLAHLSFDRVEQVPAGLAAVEFQGRQAHLEADDRAFVGVWAERAQVAGGQELAPGLVQETLVAQADAECQVRHPGVLVTLAGAQRHDRGAGQFLGDRRVAQFGHGQGVHGQYAGVAGVVIEPAAADRGAAPQPHVGLGGPADVGEA